MRSQKAKKKSMCWDSYISYFIARKNRVWHNYCQVNIILYRTQKKLKSLNYSTLVIHSMRSVDKMSPHYAKAIGILLSNNYSLQKMKLNTQCLCCFFIFIFKHFGIILVIILYWVFILDVDLNYASFSPFSFLVTLNNTVGHWRAWGKPSRHSCGSRTIPSSAHKHFEVIPRKIHIWQPLPQVKACGYLWW